MPVTYTSFKNRRLSRLMSIRFGATLYEMDTTYIDAYRILNSHELTKKDEQTTIKYDNLLKLYYQQQEFIESVYADKATIDASISAIERNAEINTLLNWLEKKLEKKLDKK